MDDLLSDFLTEAREGLAELDVALVRLERTPDDGPTLSLIFRLVHTIKGTCGFLGLPRLERVAHAAESVLGRVRDGVLPVSPGLISLVLAALDAIRAILAALAATGAEPEGDDATLIAALDTLANGEAASTPPPATDPAVPEPASTSQTIRVGVEVLEDLMTLVSELVLTRNQILQLARTQENAAFAVPLQRLSHITSELQEGVMKTRMQPIGNAWNKLPRLVRDLGHELDKKIELAMRGAETELDRQVLELIKDPLTHMVRNSADHGLEPPAARRAAGKPEAGTITLNAFHEGGHIIIEIGDDGRGLPAERIRAKALAQGLATEAELAGMGEAQIQQFIFRAGFSTAAAVTAVSGRGVGMDVVKTNIERIGGTIGLNSTAGAGTVFTIKIPLTLAIVSALIVEAGGERFAIPQIAVVELVRTGSAATGAVERINDTPELRLRERLLPLVNLKALLALEADAPARGSNSGDSTIVVVQVGAASLGIMVDRVFDTEEIVVKPVAPILRHITMFSGNTILGDGSVIMILDPNGIARATGAGAEAEVRQAASRNGADAQMRSDDRTAMLIFRANGAEPKAVPLGLVARLEEIPRARIERSGGALVTQYRGRLLPLVCLGEAPAGADRQPVLVFADGPRSMGLMVSAIVDVVEETLNIELSSTTPGLLGTAVIAGQATDLIDTGYWLAQAFGGSCGGWFHRAAEGGAGARVLVVEDSAFFRELVVPSLAAAGCRVVAAGTAAQALRLREAGEAFDLIVSDIEMPEMDGYAFARAARASGPWAGLPMIALTSRAEPEDVARALSAGFTRHVAKLDRDTLLAAVRECLARPVPA
ncbi:MAG TPA: chemotaxis protein CheW [Acetobacteraceae bacterium]|nr:chemotaxis protein CheW [Acetobacteraceae bacterium]